MKGQIALANGLILAALLAPPLLVALLPHLAGPGLGGGLLAVVSLGGVLFVALPTLAVGLCLSAACLHVDATARTRVNCGLFGLGALALFSAVTVLVLGAWRA